MSVSTSEDPIAGLRSLTLDKEEDDIPQQDKSLGDLPPEVLTKILEWLTGCETRNNVLSYRLVNHQWKDILDDLIEKKLESGSLQPFPAMKIGGESTELLQVRCSPTVFRANGDPFPFSSLLLSGNAELNFMPESATDIQMDLPVFISEFGGNLTSFALHDQKIPVSTLVAMIGSLPRLKRLSLLNVLPDFSVMKPDAVLPTSPPLPSLSTIEVKSAPLNDQEDYVDEKRNMWYIWLIASYADQLVRLNLATDDPFPPLRIQHQYSVSLPNDKLFLVGTTSESAFGNLKELNVVTPSWDFLNESETPALQQLSVTGIVDWRSIVLFVVKCGGTIEKLNLDVRWNYFGMFPFLSYGGQLKSTEGATIPKLKTLAINYPSEDSYERMLSEELLVMSPALEVLHLLHFQPHYFDSELPSDEVGEGGNEVGGTDDDIAALKEQCAVLWQELAVIQEEHTDAWNDHRMNWRGNMWRDPEDPDEREHETYVMILELAATAVGDRMEAVKTERDAVLRRLVALGEKREKVMVEQLLDRGGIWNICPNLKIVTVSSGSKPVGDICRVRKPKDD